MNAIDRRRLLMMLAGLWLFPASARPAAAAQPVPLVELPGDVEAPDFLLPDLTGDVHRLSDYRGQPLLVSFWAAWCAPCRRELPLLAALRERLRDANVEVLTINLGDTAERIAAFLEDHPSPRLPILLGDHATGQAWHVQGLPIAYGIDAEGILRLGALGEEDWDAPIVEHQLRRLSRLIPSQQSRT